MSSTLVTPLGASSASPEEQGAGRAARDAVRVRSALLGGKEHELNVGLPPKQAIQVWNIGE